MPTKMPSGWAIKVAGIQRGAIRACVREYASTKWFPAWLIVTDSDVIKAERGIFRRKRTRIPRSRVASIQYERGLMRDTIAINVSGGDLPDTHFTLSKNWRDQAEELVGLLENR